MEQIAVFFNGETLGIAKTYLFGNVKYLDLLMLLMFIDIVTGILSAIKERRLRSRTALYGYARKIAVFGIIILANVIDIILNLSGAVTMGTVLFYIANEGLSILENAKILGAKSPKFLLDKLQVVKDGTIKEKKKNDE
ncbi:phage holin family protein [Shouchella lehensis]|uniref:Holin n=1 Tax=Shouchella lehensis TaxID=300825 RepID=A0A4Y7WDG7_9BACI|nr:phage holin family protein [Shouchella lehensis]MBG9783598.1 holin [Shouchella lehensis]TES45644.1 holin [Shouchella lehensis]